jgi:hypothetical protein
MQPDIKQYLTYVRILPAAVEEMNRRLKQELALLDHEIQKQSTMTSNGYSNSRLPRQLPPGPAKRQR